MTLSHKQKINVRHNGRNKDEYPYINLPKEMVKGKSKHFYLVELDNGDILIKFIEASE